MSAREASDIRGEGWDDAAEEKPSAPRLKNRFLARGRERDARRKERTDKKRVTDGQWKRALDEVDARIESGEWKDARPVHFAALFAVMHEDVYGVEPVDMTPEVRLLALFAAKRLLEKEFSEDGASFAKYVRWIWQREQDRADRARKAGYSRDFRLNWRLQFGMHLLADYRVHEAQVGRGA